MELNEDESLTNRHAITLKFLEQKVSENEELKLQIANLESQLARCSETQELLEENKERMKDMQEACLARADNLNMDMAKKHQEELMKKIEEQLTLERQWLNEKEQMLAKIEELESEKKSLAGGDQKIKEITAEAESLQAEVYRLKDVLRHMEDTDHNRSSELERLSSIEALNSALSSDLLTYQQRIRELESTLSELQKVDSSAEDDSDLVNSLNSRLGDLQEEKILLETRAKELEMLLEKSKKELAHEKCELAKERENLLALRREIINLNEQIRNLQSQKRPAPSVESTFHDFVKLKRELIAAKNENDLLRQKLKSESDGIIGLPVLRILPHIAGDNSPQKSSVVKARVTRANVL